MHLSWGCLDMVTQCPLRRCGIQPFPGVLAFWGGLRRWKLYTHIKARRRPGLPWMTFILINLIIWSLKFCTLGVCYWHLVLFVITFDDSELPQPINFKLVYQAGLKKSHQVVEWTFSHWWTFLVWVVYLLAFWWPNLFHFWMGLDAIADPTHQFIMVHINKLGSHFY